MASIRGPSGSIRRIVDRNDSFETIGDPHVRNPQAQIDQLAKFLIENVPALNGSLNGWEVADLAIQLLRQHLPVPVEGERFWSCTIGPAPDTVPWGGDFPLRRAVQKAFIQMFKCSSVFHTFSGWNAHLTAGERNVARLR